MIQKYQIKKYGAILDGSTRIILGDGVRYNKEKCRMYQRFGSKTERNKRNLKRKYEVNYEKFSA